MRGEAEPQGEQTPRRRRTSLNSTTGPLGCLTRGGGGGTSPDSRGGPPNGTHNPGEGATKSRLHDTEEETKKSQLYMVGPSIAFWHGGCGEQVPQSYDGQSLRPTRGGDEQSPTTLPWARQPYIWVCDLAITGGVVNVCLASWTQPSHV